MGMTGNIPYYNDSNSYGKGRITTKAVRTQTLQPGQVVLYAGHKYTISYVSKSVDLSNKGYLVGLVTPTGKTKVVNKLPGFAWHLLEGE